ncbi:hypothetical protein M199_gp179 [Halogranum tailed virus 1]|uniref:Uncharacterized protein n=1 Tax=Halogranum tailed virus 1 TaxID=1273749 RepID=R4TLC9_9CAUD|nr:hypothetical protein M199_gp179 [Halogranum tailed virus 1]AGM11487.1 hypothetical protein HGTV1_190 [Halogranum tailed virus 1]
MVQIDGFRYNLAQKKVTLIFDTSRGYHYLSCTRGKVREMREEQPLHYFPKREQEEMRGMVRVAYAMLYDREDLR